MLSNGTVDSQPDFFKMCKSKSNYKRHIVSKMEQMVTIVNDFFSGE